MTSSHDPLRLTIVCQRGQMGWTTATIPAVPGALAVPGDAPAGAAREEVVVTLELARDLDRGH